MSLTNPKKVVTEERLSAFYQELLPYLGGIPDLLANKFSKGDLYSTDEQMIGQWIDGKPLYQKTFSGTVESKTNYTAHDLGVVGGIDTIVNISGIMDNNKPMIAVSNDAFTASIAFYMYPNDFSTASKRNTYECFAKPDANQTYVGHTFIFHLQYTKASDSAIAIGSDTDYSTEEKIVGTWIDGRPVYQKTITGTAPSSSSTQNIQIGANVENALVIGGYCQHSSFLTPINAHIDTNEYLMVWVRNNSHPTVPSTLGIKAGSVLYGGSYNITLQYTKPSST